MNSFSGFEELTNDELMCINGGDALWSRVAQAVGDACTTLKRGLQHELAIYLDDPELYRAIHGK